MSKKKSKVAAGTGLVVGTGMATVGSNVVTTAVSTFGTASTGTAISALSGAAAKSATLAAIGGGSLATGGGGIALGTTVLTAIPVFGFALALGCGAYLLYKDKK